MSDQKPIGGVPFSEVALVRLHAHVAVQSLARATRSGLEAQPGDAHTNLGWDPVSGVLWTHDFSGGAAYGLDVAELTLHLRDPERGATALKLGGLTPDDAESWVLEHMNSIGAKSAAFGESLPYEVPDAGKVLRFAAAGDASRELANWFDRAHASLTACAVSELGLAEDAVRCWPHHFDLGALLALEQGDPETASSISIGMSPGDGSYDEPYFYVTPWPRPDADPLPAVKLGHWHTEGFTSLVLTATELLGVAEEDPGAATRRFLSASVATGRALLA